MDTALSAQANWKVRVLKNLDVTDLAGEKVMIDFDSGNYFMLRGAANDIWDTLRDGVTVAEIVTALQAQYDVDAQTCADSTMAFLRRIEEIGFVKLEN